MDAKLYTIYKLYFEWNLKPKDINYYCPWWARVSSYTFSNSDSIKSIINKVLDEYTLNLMISGRMFIIDQVAVSATHIIKFIRKYQFDSFLGRIKNILKGTFIILVSVLKIPFSV